MKPPMIGPSTGARTDTEPMIDSVRAIRRGPASRAMIVWAIGNNAPPPMPWIARNATSEPSDHASPHRAEPMVNTSKQAR